MYCRFARSTTVFTLIALLVCVAIPVFAQVTSGNIVGNIYDASGATVPNVEVTAINDGTGAASFTHSTSSGDYRFENLPVGVYTISTSPVGFAKAQLKNVDVKLNFTVTANLNLNVGSASITINVSDSAAAIDTTTAQIQNTFETRQLSDLPVTAVGSGVLNLSLLNAGVASSGSVGAGTGPSVAGQRPRNNNFTVEGIDNNSGSVTGPLVTVPNDAVAEFSTLQNQFSPDFGHSSGGQFNTIVKSGTNKFTGTLYEYVENKNFDAADTINAVAGTPLHPRYDNNRFGGNVGGPIIRNKLFFFADYEYNPVGQAGSAGLLYAPTATGYATIAATPGVNQTNLSILRKYLGTPATPVSASSIGGYPVLSTLAAGPEYLQSAIAGTPIQLGQTSITAPSYSNNEAGIASIDYNISENDSLRGRFVLNRSGSIDAVADLPAFFQTTPSNNYLVAFSEYHNFSPTLINEFRLGYNRHSGTTPAGNLSFPGLDQFPNLYINELNAQLGPDPSAPQAGSQNTYQLTENITWTKGAHAFKAGFDGVRAISPRIFTQRSRGDYEYNYLNDYLFDFQPDILAERSQGNPVYWGNRWLFGGYLNDNYKVNPHITVNLGVRYEYNTIPAAEAEQSLNAAASVPGLINFAKPKAQNNNVMPRIGLAYSPGTDGKTSIRAGFGINYDVLYDNLGILTLPPELSTTSDVTRLGGSNFLASGGIPPTGPSAGLTVAQARLGTSGYVPDVKRPKSLQWNFGIEHEFGGSYIFETRYIGTRGIDLDTQNQLNRQPVVSSSNALPVYWSAPSQAQLNGLTSTLAALNAAYKAGGDIVLAYLATGFTGIITSYQPNGSSTYHGWASQLTRRFSNGLQFMGAYTLSHAIDNSTADLNTTSSTPRRALDSRNIGLDRSSSALDHRNRITIEAVYDLPYFKHSNWLLKNVVGNWEFAPIYTYQTGTLYTVQSGLDSNLNGDTASDRAITNPNGGNPDIGSGTTALKNSTGAVVAYLVKNPAAKYATAPAGTISTTGRNTGMLPPTDNIDLFAAKHFTFLERANLELSARFLNVFNHAQYTGGYLSDVQPNGAGTAQRNVFIPTSAQFNQPSQEFSSNPRSITFGAKLTF